MTGVRQVFLLLVALWAALDATSATAQSLRVDGRHIVDTNGNRLLLRGANLTKEWDENQHGAQTRGIVDFLRTNATVARVSWRANYYKHPQTGEDITHQKVKTHLDLVINAGRIAISANHGFTGWGYGATLDAENKRVNPEWIVRNHWLPLKDYLNSNRHRLIVNIVNEWGGGGENAVSDEVWRDEYIKAVRALRDAGVENLIMIDANGWGQNHSAIEKFGRAVLEADPHRNVIFSIHPYGEWRDALRDDTNGRPLTPTLKRIVDQNLPLFIGEFGGNPTGNFLTREGAERYSNVQLIKEVESLGLGWCIWSWTQCMKWRNTDEDGMIFKTDDYTYGGRMENLSETGRQVLEAFDRPLPAVHNGARAAGAPVDSVDPFIGSVTTHPSSPGHGLGKTFPGPCTPFGLVQLSPDTVTGGDNGSGYSYDHSTIEGFSFTHMSGVGWYGDFGNLQIMPQVGELTTDRESAKSSFSKQSERASAGYYAVTLDRGGIDVELTAAPRAGVIRFTFPEAQPARVKVDLARRVGGRSVKQFVRKIGDRTVEGWMDCPATGGGWGRGAGRCSYTVYFRLVFSVPMSGFGIWETQPPPDALQEDRRRREWVSKGNDPKTLPALPEPVTTIWRDRTEMTTEAGGFFIEFPTTSRQTVIARAGISFTSLEGAAANLQADAPTDDFDVVLKAARQRWADALGVIDVEGGTPSQRQIFYTSLYRTMVDPRSISDADGTFRAIDGTIQRAEGYTQRTVFSGWDVFRSQFPLMTLIAPRVVDDTINSLLYVARTDNKGKLPRWELMLRESGCMVGDPAVPVIVDAYRKGIRGYDVAQAWQAIRTTVTRDKSWREFGHATGSNALSVTLESAYADACAAWLAGELRHHADAEQLRRTAMNYRNVFDPTIGWMRARNKDGTWLDWQGATVHGQGCIESNPLQQGWFVPHDIPGLIDLLGRDRFVEQLTHMLEQTPADMRWNDFYNHANEPVHQVPFLATYAGEPWLTQRWTRAVLDRAYTTGPYGLVGNEDVGQMSAWYVLAAIGLHPACTGEPIYVITSPLFDRATIRLDPRYARGGSFTVRASRAARDAVYIQSATLNGQPLHRAWLTHDEVTAGGELLLVLGGKPSRWGAAHAPPSSLFTPIGTKP